MGDIGLLLYYAIVALFAFFVAAPCVLNAISLFGVQKRFAKAMIEEGIVPEAAVKKLHPKKQLAGVLISALVLGSLLWFCYRLQPWGFAVGIVPLFLGFWKFRAVLAYNSLTVKRFRNSYQNDLDAKKFNRYVEKNF
ncbi:MAG: hypothetical protein IJB04_06205 [Oscillospiraceae bacterium]|nr:hypothetical protein [Oscillospiraceae bacterium]